jgi:hypothetical protein
MLQGLPDPLLKSGTSRSKGEAESPPGAREILVELLDGLGKVSGRSGSTRLGSHRVGVVLKVDAGETLVGTGKAHGSPGRCNNSCVN